jgi:hypothetical protein
MTTVTQEAEEFEPLGDPTHVGYGKNYGWECTCGKSSAFSTDMHTAKSRGAEHEEYCVADGEVTIVLLTPL